VIGGSSLEVMGVTYCEWVYSESQKCSMVCYILYIPFPTFTFIINSSSVVFTFTSSQ